MIAVTEKGPVVRSGAAWVERTILADYEIIGRYVGIWPFYWCVYDDPHRDEASYELLVPSQLEREQAS